MVRLIFAKLLAALLCLAAFAASAETVLNAKTSWIGNTFGFGDGTWTQINITAIAVAPDGKVYTNAPWDESGAEASTYQNGKMLGFAGGTHGWGTGGGNAIAVNRRYVFMAVSVGNEKGHLVGQGIWPQKGKQWFGISRRKIEDPKLSALFQPAVAAANSANGAADPHAQLAAGFLMMNEVATGAHADIDGLAANDTTLYASNTTQNRIEVYDAESMQKKAAWSVHEPGRIALAPDGTLWVLTGTLTDSTPHVAHYSASGQLLADTLPLPADSVPVDIALDAHGRVLIADNGPRQQVLFFSKNAGSLRGLGHARRTRRHLRGRRGPAGAAALQWANRRRRRCAWQRLRLHQRHRSALRAAWRGARRHAGKLRARWPATLAGARAAVRRRRMDRSGAPGQRLHRQQALPARSHEAAGTGLEIRRVPVESLQVSGRPRVSHRPVAGLPIARQLKGHTFLYLTDMYADHLKIYRFDSAHDGETAIPSGFIAGRERPVANVPNAPPGGDWMWRDMNGNGQFASDEFTPNTSGTRLAGGWGWWVDTHGDIWRTSDIKGIHRLHFGGLDAKGNPVYSYSDMTTYPVPQPFTELRRAIYVPETDSLYVTGYTADAAVQAGFWKEVGRVLVRYDNWSSGKPVQRYVITLPWHTQAKPIETIIGLTVEGQYVFAVEPVGTVHVLDKDSGKEVGVIRPGPEVGKASGWVDVPNGVSAYRRSDGEYLVFVEEDARGKVMMYRWKPA